MTAGYVCKREVVICRPQDSVLEATRRMRDFHVGCVIAVAEREGVRVPVGILTDRDVITRMVAFGRTDFASRTVAEEMSDRLVTAEERESLIDVLKRMRAHGIRRLPVVDEAGGLQGLLTFDDLVELLAEEAADLRTLVTRELRREGAAPQPLSEIHR